MNLPNNNGMKEVIQVPDCVITNVVEWQYRLDMDKDHNQIWIVIWIPFQPFIKYRLLLGRIPLAEMIANLQKGQQAFNESETIQENTAA